MTAPAIDDLELERAEIRALIQLADMVAEEWEEYVVAILDESRRKARRQKKRDERASRRRRPSVTALRMGVPVGDLPW